VKHLVTACVLVVAAAALAGPGCGGKQSTGPAAPGQPGAGSDPASPAAAGALSASAELTTDEALVKLLQGLGISDVTVLESGKILFRIEGIAMALFRFPDGDLQLYYGVGGVRCPFEPINEWNEQHRHSRAYLDDEEDPVIESDLLSDGGMSQEKLEMFVRTFQMSAGQFLELLGEHCTLSQDREA
jgi:Putative bacterial sensory transduction regulator